MKKTIKTTTQMGMLRDAGLLLWQTHQFVKKLISPGANPVNIDMAAEDFIRQNGATPTFKGVGEVAHPFPSTICFSVNNEVVHGIPTTTRIKSGDIVSVDIGLRLNGWCSDAARTYVVDDNCPAKHALVNATQDALNLAISQIEQQKTWMPIAEGIQTLANGRGFSIVEEYVGHGIGEAMWEEPSVPNHRNENIFKDFELETGLVIAIEPILTQKGREVYVGDDHWTVKTVDGGLAAHIEDSVAITDNGPVVLTRGPFGEI